MVVNKRWLKYCVSHKFLILQKNKTHYLLFRTNLDRDEEDDSAMSWEEFGVSECCNACFKDSTIWLMDGLSSGFFFKQLSANLAILRAAWREYWFLRRGSIITANLLVSAGYCFTQSRSFCSAVGRFLSNDLLPVRISYSTTPKLHMSLWTFRWPVSMYSGAAYPCVPTT